MVEKSKESKTTKQAEGTDPGPETHTLTGGPGTETSSQNLVTVQVGGKDVQVPPEVAEALKKAEKSPKSDPVLEEIKREMAEMKKAITPAKTTSKAEKEASPPAWDDLLYSDPAKFVAQFEDRITKKLTEKYESAQEQQAAQGQIQQFWREFATEFTDLSDDIDIAEVVLNRNYNSLKDKPVAEAKKELAELTRKRLKRESKKEEKGEGEEDRTHTELPSSKSPVVQKKGGEDKVVTLSGHIRARQAQKRKSA